MSLLHGLQVVQLGPGLAAAVCGRLFADSGACVVATAPARSNDLAGFLDHGKPVADNLTDAIAAADLIICEGTPGELRDRDHDPGSLRQLNAAATIATLSGFGQHGPNAEHPATDLTLFCASGIARMLTGQVDDLSEPPLHPVGRQSAFIGGLAAACAAMAAIAARDDGATIDVSLQEALATLAVSELAQVGLGGAGWSRKRHKDGNGATVTILPASDGYVAISPREERQWARWLEVMGTPEWAGDPRFARKPDRVDNWDALYDLMCAWSRDKTKQWIADAAQAAHVPSFPLSDLSEHLASEQLAHRDFFKPATLDGRTIAAPSAPFRLTPTAQRARQAERQARLNAGSRPLDGLRVLDFSWVIAGPTATRHLAALGADVIKVEAPGRGDPARTSHLHTVLGQNKRGIVLDLKHKQGVDIAKALVAQSDVLIENFATGVMDRLGLDAGTLQAANPNLICLSASGLGRTGPDNAKVAYGTLLQSFSGFAGLNRHPGTTPRVGFAWLDPMCGLMLPFCVSAAVWHRQRTGSRGMRIDFSMLEAMVWTLAEPLIAAQRGVLPEPTGNASQEMAPHNVYPCAGDDQWIGLAVRGDADWQRLSAHVPGLATRSHLGLTDRQAALAEIDATIAAWTRSGNAFTIAADLSAAGIPASAVAGAHDLVADDHLAARGFWEPVPGGVLPALPWQASFGRDGGPAPALGGDTDAVLRDVLGMSDAQIAEARAGGALG